MSEAVSVFPTPGPRVRLVPMDRPWEWLALGWRDLTRAPRVSLTYGVLLVLVSFAVSLVLYLTDLLYLLLPMTAGFMLVAPALAVGLYETSRRLAGGEPVSLGASFGAWRSNWQQIAALGLVLMLLHLLWVRIAMLLYPLFFSETNPALFDLVDQLLFSADSIPFLVVGSVLGAILAAAAFTVAAISIPMLIDRNVSVFTAIATSAVAVRNNPRAMALWAALIVAFTVAGLALFYVGLAVTLPLIAHASWHCYRDLVEGPLSSERT